MPPVYTLSQITDQLKTSFSTPDAREWASNNVSYSIGYSPHTNNEGAGYVSMSSHMINMAVEAFEYWDDLINIDLNRSFTSSSDITFNYSNLTQSSPGVFYNKWRLLCETISRSRHQS